MELWIPSLFVRDCTVDACYDIMRGFENVQGLWECNMTMHEVIRSEVTQRSNLRCH